MTLLGTRRVEARRTRRMTPALLALLALGPGLTSAPPPTSAEQRKAERHAADIQGDIEAGAKYSVEVEKELKLSTDASMQARVDRVGKELAAIANSTPVAVSWGDSRLNAFPYKFKVVQGKDVNAFSIPGGFVYVYEGLVKYVETDDELAGVLAHEVSHASFRHLATLRKEQSRLDAITIPLILVSILAGGQNGVNVAAAGSYLNQAIGSGWSVKAETAADWGGLQYLAKSRYNPVGALTFMERLGFDEKHQPQYDLGIFRTHPPSRERAQSIIRHLNEMKVPIARSVVTRSLRAEVKPSDAGVEIRFNGQSLATFGGTRALSRADEAAVALNSFFDSVPKLYDAQAGVEGAVLGRGQTLFVFTGDDVAATGKPIAELQSAAVAAIKRASFDLAYRVWNGY